MIVLYIRKVRVPHPHGKTVGGKGIQFATGWDMRFFLQFHQFPDTMRRDGAGQERRNDGQHTPERTRKSRTLLHEQGHGTIGDGMRPEQIQAIEESQELHQHPHNRHIDIRLDGEPVEIQADIPELPLPPTQLSTVLVSNAKRLDGIEIIESLHLERHHLTAHFPHFLPVFPLFLDDRSRNQQQEWRTGKGNPRHGRIVMQDHKEAGEELVHGNHDGRQPTDGISAHRANVTGKSVQHIPVAILVDGHVVRIDNLVEDIRLNIVVDGNVQLGGDAADEATEHQTEDRAAHHDAHHDPQLAGLIPRDDINQVFPGDATHQSHGRTENPQDQVKGDSSLVAQAIRENPFPVVQNLLERPFPPSFDQDIERLERGTIYFFVNFFHFSLNLRAKKG